MLTIARRSSFVAIAVALTGCANAVHFYETEKITLLTVEGGADPSRQISGTLGFGQRVVLITPPKKETEGESVSALAYFRMSKDNSEVTINSALVTGAAANSLTSSEVKMTTRNWSQAVQQEVATQVTMAEDVANKLSPNGTYDPKLLVDVLAKPPASDFSQSTKQSLIRIKTKQELAEYLRDAPPAIAKKLQASIAK